MIWCAAFVLLYLNRTLPPYADEADNLLGGRIVAQGGRLYTDYFSQHMPLPYLLAAFATWLGAHDLIGYRVFFLLLVALVLGGIMLAFRARLSATFVGVLVLMTALCLPMFSGHMFLADHLFALSLLVAVLVVLARGPRLGPAGQITIAACAFVALQSTLVAVYPFALIVGYCLVAAGRPNPREQGRFLTYLAAPHVVLIGLLALAGLFEAWFDQAVRFNQTYYSRYELGADPLSILRVTLPDILNDFVTYIRPDAWHDVQTFFLLSNVAAIIVVWRTRGIGLALLYLALIPLSRMRGNAGYHGSPYMAMTVVSMAVLASVALPHVIRAIRERDFRMRLATVLSVAYLAYGAYFIRDVAGFYRRLPRDADLDAPAGRVVAALTRPQDRVWMGPFEPYVYLVAQRQPSSSIWYVFPWLADSPNVMQQLTGDLQAAPPPVVVFDADRQIPWYFSLPRPSEYAAPVYQFLERNYVPLDENDPVLSEVYLLREREDELRQRLRQ